MTGLPEVGAAAAQNLDRPYLLHRNPYLTQGEKEALLATQLICNVHFFSRVFSSCDCDVWHGHTWRTFPGALNMPGISVDYLLAVASALRPDSEEKGLIRCWSLFRVQIHA